MKQISLASTFILKFIVPPIIVIFPLIFFLLGAKSKFYAIILWLLLTLITSPLWKHLISLKAVFVGADFILISNFKKKLKINFVDIEKIEENIFSSKITFRSQNEFGKYVYFKLPHSFRLLKEDPLITEIKNKISLNNCDEPNSGHNDSRITRHKI